MRLRKSAIAAAELLLVFPATLFMTALFLRQIQPQQYEPAHTAQRIVNWYASSTHVGLWLLLMALPLTVLITGSVTLFGTWRNDSELRQATRQALAAIRANLSTLLIAAATVASAGILGIVALHVMTD